MPIPRAQLELVNIEFRTPNGKSQARCCCREGVEQCLLHGHHRLSPGLERGQEGCTRDQGDGPI
jgi:hypothetical protein